MRKISYITRTCAILFIKILIFLIQEEFEDIMQKSMSKPIRSMSKSSKVLIENINSDDLSENSVVLKSKKVVAVTKKIKNKAN